MKLLMGRLQLQVFQDREIPQSFSLASKTAACSEWVLISGGTGFHEKHSSLSAGQLGGRISLQSSSTSSQDKSKSPTEPAPREFRDQVALRDAGAIIDRCFGQLSLESPKPLLQAPANDTRGPKMEGHCESKIQRRAVHHSGWCAGTSCMICRSKNYHNPKKGV